MMCALFLLAAAGGMPSFEGGYLEEEKRRSVYVNFESADCTYSPRPPGTDIEATLFAVSSGYSHSFKGRRRGSCPAAFVDIAGQCSNVQAELLVQSTDTKGVPGDGSSDLALLAVRYAARSIEGVAFFAACGIGALTTDETDAQFQLGLGAGSGTGVSEIRLMYYWVQFAEGANPDCAVFLVEGQLMHQPISENWFLFGARWKTVDIDGETGRDTSTFSASLDWYFRREAYVGIELSTASSDTAEPHYFAPPAGALGEYIGCRVRCGYEEEDYFVSAWVEPRIRDDGSELAWGFSGAFKF